MKSLRWTLVLFAFLLCGFRPGLSQTNGDELLAERIRTYFQQALKLPARDIYFRLLHAPLWDGKGVTSADIRIGAKNNPQDLGYQTLWVEVYRNGQLRKKFPISVEVSVETEVVVSTVPIRSRQVVKPDMLQRARRRIRHNLNRYVRSPEEIVGLETVSFIPAGEIFTTKMVKIPPVVRRGQRVDIKIIVGNLEISTSGIAKNNGQLGDRIQVLCESTRKKLTGIVQAPNLVIVQK